MQKASSFNISDILSEENKKAFVKNTSPKSSQNYEFIESECEDSAISSGTKSCENSLIANDASTNSGNRNNMKLLFSVQSALYLSYLNKYMSGAEFKSNEENDRLPGK